MTPIRHDIRHADDLALARACVAGEPAALAALERCVVPEVRHALAQLGRSRAEVDDIVQRLRHHLLLGDDGRPPRLAHYAGRGSLRRWVKTVAIRIALRDTRRAARTTPVDAALLEQLGSVAAGGAVDWSKARDRAAVQAALADALRSLAPAQRNALRLHAVDRVSLERVARIYGVHRATMARWLATTRDMIRTRTLDALAERLAATRSEAQSLLRYVLSGVELELG